MQRRQVAAGLQAADVFVGPVINGRKPMGPPVPLLRRGGADAGEGEEGAERKRRRKRREAGAARPAGGHRASRTEGIRRVFR